MGSFGNMERDLENMRECFRQGRTKEATWRKSQLKGLLTLMKEKEQDIFKALQEDLGKHYIEAFRDEIGTVTKSLNTALESLKGWMSGRKAKLPKIALLSTAEIVPEPLGLVLIFSSWNFPFGLSLEPLIGAIAAGNAVVLKPSELSPACASVLANNLPRYLDRKAVKVFQGGQAVGEELLQHKWDKIFFTGSARVGRLIMSAAAKHLTPVTLELGGKCPVVVDSLPSSWEAKANFNLNNDVMVICLFDFFPTANQKVAVKRVLVGKFGACAGQACIAVDYVLAEKNFAPTLVELMKVTIKEMFGENPKETSSISRIINKGHFLRLKNLLKDPKVEASIVHGGSLDEDNLFIEPTILVDPPLEAAIMTEEIFGPLLPIITLEKIEDSVQFINSRSKALAIYCFTKNKSFERRMVSDTSSGSILFNDVIIQYIADTLPFGGVGESGTGRYHGKFSFDTFSHERAIGRRSLLTDFWFRFPPWNIHKLLLLESAYNLDYLDCF
ncbi:Aldehyde dehydrogenase family 3 member F1 [Morella rubra]|uniref:Aldehyde dehydrogenase n=1 Tax=Morella rubra TaxID=262757 RepID=A0A6A1WVA2_9ROSI|nr:Aldehyde dehydrogenase family 3 member F1 [Morella rubra]